MSQIKEVEYDKPSEEVRKLLKKNYGFSEFRDHQVLLLLVQFSSSCAEVIILIDSQESFNLVIFR